MKTQSIRIITLLLALSMLLPSCESVNNANKTQKGAAIGTTAGGVIGGILGNNIGGGNTGLGILIGAAVGGAAGGIIGNKMDKQATEISNALPGAEVERVGEGIRVVLGENTVNFAFDSDELTETTKANLNKLIGALNQETQTDLQIQGYTDAKGSDDYNQKLSERRAKSVYKFLVANGIAADRLSTIGYGEQNPIATNDTDEGRAQNRRVEFIITASDEMKENAQQQADSQ